MEGYNKTREAAITSKNKLKEINFVCPNLSDNKPLGTEKISDDIRGIATIILATKSDIPKSLIRIGKRTIERLL